MYVVYLVTCQRVGHYYVGYSRRELYPSRTIAHSCGRGAAFVRRNGFMHSVVLEERDTLEEAKKAERLWVLRMRGCDVVVAGAGWSSEDLWRERRAA